MSLYVSELKENEDKHLHVLEPIQFCSVSIIADISYFKNLILRKHRQAVNYDHTIYSH